MNALASAGGEAVSVLVRNSLRRLPVGWQPDSDTADQSGPVVFALWLNSSEADRLDGLCREHGRSRSEILRALAWEVIAGEVSP